MSLRAEERERAMKAKNKENQEEAMNRRERRKAWQENRREEIGLAEVGEEEIEAKVRELREKEPEVREGP